MCGFVDRMRKKNCQQFDIRSIILLIILDKSVRNDIRDDKVN